MADEAMAAGFNPLTVLRSGLGAGFSTQRTEYGVVAGGSFTQDAPLGHSDPIPQPVSSGYMFDPSTGFGGYDPDNGSLDDERAFDAWARATGAGAPTRDGYNAVGGSSEPATLEYMPDSEFNIAVHQLRLRNKGTGNVVTDDGVVISTKKGVGQHTYKGVPTAGGMLNPITYTRPTAIGGVPAKPKGKLKPGQQADQIWDKDKLPSVVQSSTFHEMFPGVYWEESGGSTRGDTWDNIYGDDGPKLPLILKNLNDIGLNVRRAWDANMPTLPKVVDAWGRLPWGQVPADPGRIGHDGTIWHTGGGF